LGKEQDSTKVTKKTLIGSTEEGNYRWETEEEKKKGTGKTWDEVEFGKKTNLNHIRPTEAKHAMVSKEGGTGHGRWKM